MVSGMVTRIRQSARRRLFLKEHREAKGLSAQQMADRLDITRESLYRQEREAWRVNSDKQVEWAAALGIEPESLWRLPRAPDDPPSLDEMIRDAPKDVREMAADIVRRLVGRGR
jgi:transcriptional regulator with XRE-family HTH domain